MMRAISLTLGLMAGMPVYAGALSDVKDAAKEKIYEITGQDTTVLHFDKGSAHLPSGSTSTLRSLLNAVREQGPVKEVLVIAYSDLPYPHAQKTDLPVASRHLAESRGDAVEKELKGLGASSIKVVNMAEKANWFEKAFDTEGAEIKHETAAAPAHESSDDAFYESLGRRLKKDAPVGSVEVVLRHDGKYAH